jgi:transposase
MLEIAQREYIRYLHFHKGLSIRAIAAQVGCHRQTVKRYIENPLHKYTRKAPVVYPVLGPVRQVIDQWLESDLTQPPKQRHTARSIYQRLKDEYGFKGGETTVRDYVHKWRLAHQPKEVW